MEIEFVHSKAEQVSGYWLASHRNRQGKLLLAEGSSEFEALSGIVKMRMMSELSAESIALLASENHFKRLCIALARIPALGVRHEKQN